MEEAVVGAVVGASIQVLLQNLLNISLEQINLFSNCKNDLEMLKKSFSMVKDFLDDAETRQVTDKAVKRWLWELEALAFDADNVFDDINYQLLFNKVETTQNKPMKKKVQSFLSISNNPIAYRLNLGRRIKDILERLAYINQRASEFGLQTRIAIAQAPASGSNASGSTETDSFTVDPFFYGRKEDVERIVGMLITTPSLVSEQVLSILPIVGMGGLGKTTLARKVFNDVKIKTEHFSVLVWVHVPKVFDVLVLLKNILASLTTKNAEHGNRQAILKNLQAHLGAKKYLMVLDDVWNEDREKWDDFVKSLSGISSATGNCMIVTTRSQEVASIVGTLTVHKLKGLSEDDCWSIIKVRAFRGGDSPFEFEKIGRNIANRCKGLPLAAKVFGGLLFGKSEDEWLVIEKKPLSNFGDKDHVWKILKLSFDSLSPPSLKKCFAYCSIFPKGYDIEKEKLIELWMAEGFLQTDGRNNINMEKVGSSFLNILVQNSLLQVSKRDSNGNVTLYNMHDLVHDLSYSILHENDKDTGAIFQSRYIGWKPSGDGLLFIPQGQEKYVRTLFFDGEISDINFSDLESLHSLTLMGDHINELPTSIRDLKHLRYLDISESSIRYLTESIDELYHMQTLRTKKKWGRCYFEKLPDSLSNLINLRHLHISKFTDLPLGIGKLTSLQTLPFFNVGGEKGCGISEMNNLKDLKGKVNISNLEKVHGKLEAASADLLGKTNIYKLRVVWDPSRIEADEEANDDENVLEGLQPHPNLKSLSICWFKGKSLPLWTTKMAVQLDGRCCWEGLDNLMVIKIKDCSAVVELPMLGHLPHLKALYLCRMEKVRSIGPSFYNVKGCSKSRTSFDNNINEGVVVFGALERLELLKMSSLVEWAGVDCLQPHELDHVYFPKLKYLKVEGCTQLTSAPSHDFPRLETLVIRDMESSLPLESICGIKSASLTSLNIKRIQGLECLPYDLHRLNALEELHISSCKSLKSIPYPPSNGGQQQSGFTSLRKLWIRNCKGLASLPIEMVESCATSLEELTLCELSNITNIPMVIGCMYRMPHLRELAISGVPEFSFKQLDIGLNTIDGLQTLHMGPFSDSSSWDHDNVSLNEVVDDMLLQFTSVCKLILVGMEHWECLPYQLQHLTSLRVLYLWNYGIEALPEWFENLSSLEVLTVNSFKKLRHLPSKLAMLRLSKLKFLDIIRCPLLLKEKNSDSDIVDEMIVESEWFKISHINYITVEKTRNY